MLILIKEIEKELLEKIEIFKDEKKKNYENVRHSLTHCGLVINSQSNKMVSRMHTKLSENRANLIVYNCGYDREIMKNVVIHEYVHLIANVLYGRNMKHSKIYKDLGQMLTGIPRKYFCAKVELYR